MTLSSPVQPLCCLLPCLYMPQLKPMDYAEEGRKLLQLIQQGA